jgi:hypothetical protein
MDMVDNMDSRDIKDERDQRDEKDHRLRLDRTQRVAWAAGWRHRQAGLASGRFRLAEAASGRMRPDILRAFFSAWCLLTAPAAQNSGLRGTPRAGLFAGLVEDVSKGAGCLHTANIIMERGSQLANGQGVGKGPGHAFAPLGIGLERLGTAWTGFFGAYIFFRVCPCGRPPCTRPPCGQAAFTHPILWNDRASVQPAFAGRFGPACGTLQKSSWEGLQSGGRMTSGVALAAKMHHDYAEFDSNYFEL